MQAKRFTKLGLICSVSSLLMVSGCSIWQEKGPDRYGLAPGAKRIPALNPGGKMAAPATPPVVQGQPQMAAPAGASPMGFASAPPATMAPPMAYAPPVAYNAPPPMMPPQGNGFIDQAAMQAMAPPPASFAPNITPPPPLAPVAPVAGVQSPFPSAPQEPFDLTSTSLDRGAGFPSLSQVPQAPASSADRVSNAQAAANELQQELNQNQAQRMAAQQQVTQDGLPWDAAPQATVAPGTFEVSTAPAASGGGNVSLDEIDRRFAGPRSTQESIASLPSATAQPAPAEPLRMPPSMPRIPSQGMTAIEPNYQFPAPDASFRMTEPSPMAKFPSAPVASAPAEPLPPIKLVPPADAFEEEGAVALDVPPIRERFVPEPPEMPVPAKEEIFVPSAPAVAATDNGWDDYAAPANPIVLTPPPELLSGREEGYLPESRYEKRRRFQRRKVRF